MELKNFATLVSDLKDRGLDLTDLYVIAVFKRAQSNGDVTIMGLAKDGGLSRTIMHRRIKELVRKGVLVKNERSTDMRVKALTDGPYMPVIVDMTSAV